MKKTGIIIAVVISIGLISYGAFTLSENKKEIDKKANQKEVEVDQIPVNTYTVESDSMVGSLEILGSFEARKSLNISAESQGKISRLFVEEGQEIKKNDVIAKIHDASMEEQLRSAQSALEKSQKDVERFKNLLHSGAVSETQYEEAVLRLKSQQANVENIKKQLGFTTIKAPMDGVVSTVNIEESSFVSFGMPIATIIDVSTLKIIISMDENQVIQVKEGQKVNVVTDVYPQTVFNGTISQIAVDANQAKKYDVTVELDDDQEHQLKAGMFGRVVINNNDAKVTPVIPRSAIIGSIKAPEVYIVENGHAVKKNITIEKTIGDRIFVKEGLHPNDVVVTTGQINLTDNTKVRIIDKK